MYTGDYNDEHEDEYENPDQNIEDDDNIMKEGRTIGWSVSGCPETDHAIRHNPRSREVF